LRGPPRPSSIYFMKSGPYVKIGSAVCAWQRWTSLRTANPHELEILAVMPGDRLAEHRLQRRLKEFHHLLEWYRLEGALARYVRLVARKWPPPPKPTPLRGLYSDYI
jgi:hypothetical protein